MEHKSWPWKRKSLDKTAVAADKANTSLPRKNEEELQTLLNEKADMERELNILNGKLSSALSDCNAKDELAKKQALIAQEAIAGWEKTETEAIALKNQLDGALLEKTAAEERLVHLDEALKECMKQLRFVREEQEKRIHDALGKASKEFNGIRILLEAELAEARTRLSRLGAENSQLSRALLAKEKVIEDFNQQSTLMDADFRALLARLESTERHNASLKYEIRVLEKELEIRNEERGFDRHTTTVLHKQYLESTKKIAKLESECQRLRLLLRKRLPGPAALAKMKNEVEILSSDTAETRGRKSKPCPFCSVDISIDMAPDKPSKSIQFLTQQLYMMEEENRSLKEAFDNRENKLQTSGSKCDHREPKSSQVERHLEESPNTPKKGQLGLNINSDNLQEVSLPSMSGMGNEDKASCAESSASALLSELSLLRNGKQMGTPSHKNFGVLDINLMDDFVEMEKLAVGSANNPFANPHHASKEVDGTFSPSVTQSPGHSSEATKSAHFISNEENESVKEKIQSHSPWLEDILEMLLEQCHRTHKSVDEILEDIKVSLSEKYNSARKHYDMESSRHLSLPSAPETGGCIYPGFADESLRRDSNDKDFSAVKKSSHIIQSNVNISLCRMIELIEGINIISLDDRNSEISFGKSNRSAYNNSETPTGYMIRVFQWKTSELSAILKKFVETCRDLLQGKANLEHFAEQLTSTLEWILNHCFSIQDVSSMKDAIKSHFDWDDSQSESDVEGEINTHISDSGQLNVQVAEFSSLLSGSSGGNCSLQMEELHPTIKEECAKQKEGLSSTESGKKDSEEQPQSEIDNRSSSFQVQELEKTIKCLDEEVETQNQSKEMIKDQIGEHNMVNEHLEAQLAEGQFELDKACEKLLFSEKELENKNHSCEKLKATSDNLQLNLSMANMEVPNAAVDCKEMLAQNDWEIAAASEKLVECQETILNLGKQLRSLTSPRDAELFHKVSSTNADGIIIRKASPQRNIRQRSSLLDKMLAEDDTEVEVLKSPKLEETTKDGQAIVPVKKKKGGFLKTLLWRHRRISGKKALIA